MKHPRFAAATLALLLPMVAMAASPISVTEIRTTATTADGERLILPENPKVRASRYVIPPGVTLPVHKHPFARYAYVVAGEVDVTLTELHQTTHYKKGDFIVEAIDAWHTGTNKGRVPTELLVIDHLPEDIAENVVMQRAE